MNPFTMSVVVVGVGARTPIGLTGPATAAAARAGIAGFENHPFMVDGSGKPMIVAAAPYLGMEITGSARLAELATPAVGEVAARLASTGGKTQLPIFVGMPPVRPGRTKDVPEVLIARIREEASRYCRVAKVAAIEKGHAAGTMALQAAWEAVRSGAAEFALAGGVDSYIEPETLEWLESNDQLHSSGEENNPYGFIPGEAAGFVLLASSEAAERNKFSTVLELLKVATTRETKLIKTDSVCTGEGIIALFRELSGDPSTIQADHLYCDMNGEPYRADEFGFATIRAGKLFRDPSSFTTPADCWGDVGAASGPLLLLIAEFATRKGYAQGPVLAGFTSSESGERSGFVARKRPDERVR